MKALAIGIPRNQHNQLKEVLSNIDNQFELVIPDSIDHLKQLISLAGPFGIFILGENSNVKLLHEINQHTGPRPFIYVGAQKEFKQIQSSLAPLHPLSGHCEILDSADFTILLKQVYNQVEKKEVNNSEKYIPLLAGDLKLFDKVNCILYRLDDLGLFEVVSELHSLNNSEQILIKTEDYGKFLRWALKEDGNFLIENCSINQAFINCQLRSIFTLHSNARAIGVTELLQRFTETLIQTIIENSQKMKNIIEVLQNFPTNYSSYLTQTLTACYSACLICEDFEIDHETKRAILFALIMTDSELSPQKLFKAENLQDNCITECSEAQIRSFIDHPKTSAKMARNFDQFPDVSYLIESHHELPSRLGFPERPGPMDFGQLRAVVNLSIIFARKIDGKPAHKEVLINCLNQISKAYNIGDFKVPFKPLIAHIKYLI